MILEWEAHTWIRQVPRLARKRALQIQQEFLAECMMVLNIVDLVRKLLKNLQNMQAFRYGMVLQMNIIRHR